ncbi:MAG: lipoate protein ligase C-terminal domain-containing protein [Candidatus Thorarchaeota archaeon]
MREASFKIPDGKLVKVKLQVSSGKITELKILGDFFLHPEEAIIKIEEELIGAQHDEVSLKKIIDEVLKAEEAILIGASSSDIARTIIMAWDSK